MALLLVEHREAIRRCRPLGNGLNSTAKNKMTAISHSKTVEELLQMCAAAGAVASTTITSDSEVVVFYKDEYGQTDSFDELHIRPQKDAYILIAVFNPVSG